MSFNFDNWSFINEPPSGIDSSTNPIYLIQNRTTVGNSTPITLNLAQGFNMIAYGTFGGTVITPQWSVDGVTWTTFLVGGVDVTFTDQAEQYFLRLDPGRMLRCNLSGGVAFDVTLELA